MSERLWVVLSLCGLCSCAKPAPPPNTAYVDATDAMSENQGIGVESQDIVKISETMSRSLLSWDGFGRFTTPPRIVVMPSKNRTRYRIDAELTTTRILDALVKHSNGQFVILDRSMWDEIQAERALKERGEVDGPIAGAVAGADYFLHSELRDLTSASSSGESSYVLVNFRLVDASTTAVAWTERHEWKKEGAWGVEYQ